MKNTKDLKQNFRVPSSGEILLSDDNISDKQAPTEIQICKTGVYFCRYPWDDDLELPITVDDFRNMVTNYNSRVTKNAIFMDYDHERRDNAGVIKGLSLKNNDTELWANVEWNSMGKEDILDKRFVYVSAEIHFNYKDNETRQEHGPTLLGAALTNRPFVRGMAPVIQLSESKSPNKPNPTQPTQGKVKMNEQEVKALVEGITQKFSEQFNSVLGKVEDLSNKLAEKEKSEVELSKKHAEEMANMKKETEFNVLLSAGKVVPAQKDAFMKNDVQALLALSANIKTQTLGHGQLPVVESGDDFTARIHKEAVELSKKDGISYAEAQKVVMKSNKENQVEWEKRYSIKDVE